MPVARSIFSDMILSGLVGCAAPSVSLPDSLVDIWLSPDYRINHQIHLLISLYYKEIEGKHQ
jgi:hypothetical protein